MRNFTLFVLGWLLMLPVCAQSSKDVLWEDFREGTTDAGWTVIDGNSDGNTWGTQENLKGMVYNGLATTTPAEDWVFTPEFTLKNSSDYVIEYTVAQRGAFGADQLQLYLSTTPTLDNLTQLRAEETINVHAGTVTRKCHFVAPMSGTFYLGFKLTSTAGNGLISIKAVKVTLTNKQCPQIASAFTASHNGATGKVKLKWIAPNRDTEGALLQGKLTANVYQDEQQLTTIEDITPGVEASYEITPAAASGQTRFGIAFRNDTQISARADKTLNLEDVLGDPVKLKSFSLSTKAAFAEWTVINNDNKGAVWTYDYGSAYMPYAASADDWLITPVANVEKGKRYILKYQIKTSVGYPANMEVTVGNAATVAAQTQVVYTHTGVEQNGWGDYETSQFVPNEDGEAYFAFHATMVKNQLCVRNVELYYIEATAAGTEEEEISYTEPAEEVLKDSINADLTFTTPYHERLGSEGVNLYCAVTQGLIDEYTSCPNGIFKMDPAKQYQPNLASPDYEMLFCGRGVYLEGKLYTNAYDYRNDIQAEVPIWRVMDAKTLVTISEHRLPSNAECTTRALAYDPVTEKIFAIGRDYTNDWLAVVDPATGAMQRLGTGLDPNKRYLAIGCDSKGVLVCVYLVEDYKTGNQYNYIGRINKETGEIVEMGEIQARNMMTDDMIVNMKYRQSLFFDNATGKLYWMLCSSSMALGSQYAPVFELDPVSCTATLRTWATNIMAVSGAYFEEPAMNVPASPSDFNYEPDGEGLVTGTISFKMPTTCYDGSPLAGTLHYSVVEEEVMELTGTAQPGETVSRHIESFNGRNPERRPPCPAARTPG
ncbi:MAG: choice-of-anchor J domain-containing protein, partial [Bacteroidales bacterium]